MTTKEAQLALKQLFNGGAFHFTPALPTITEQEYEDIINSIDPVAYELAYTSEAGTKDETNIIEKCIIDRNPTNNLVDLIRKERTYEFLGYRIFQLQLDTVPLLVITGNPEDTEQKELVTTWWLNNAGKVVHYRVVYNGQIQEDIGKFNR